MVKPFLHWVGGKRQLLPEIKKYIPKEYNTYYEPFVGAGAVLFELQPKRAVINDLNEELINCYESIRDNIEEMISYLEQFQDTKEMYYQIRNMDRDPNYKLCSNAFKAARTIYLNRTCFNGLYRVNKKGYFNVSYGFHNKTRYDFYRPYNYEPESLIDTGKYLNNTSISILNTDFSQAIKGADKNDFIYFDPPYDPVSDTSNFTNYTTNGFNKDDQRRLYYTFKELSNRGCYCMLSNASTDFIKELYKDFHIIEVQANRVLNCKGNKRGKVSEVLILNYNNQTGA